MTNGTGTPESGRPPVTHEDPAHEGDEPSAPPLSEEELVGDIERESEGIAERIRQRLEAEDPEPEPEPEPAPVADAAEPEPEPEPAPAAPATEPEPPVHLEDPIPDPDPDLEPLVHDEPPAPPAPASPRRVAVVRRRITPPPLAPAAPAAARLPVRPVAAPAAAPEPEPEHAPPAPPARPIPVPRAPSRNVWLVAAGILLALVLLAVLLALKSRETDNSAGGNGLQNNAQIAELLKQVEDLKNQQLTSGTLAKVGVVGNGNSGPGNGNGNGNNVTVNGPYLIIGGEKKNADETSIELDEKVLSKSIRSAMTAEQQGKAASLQADIDEIKRQLEDRLHGLEVCRQEARESSDKHVLRQAETDCRTNEKTIARLKEQLRQKTAELRNLLGQ
jgi:hypothetical protein